MTSVKHSLFKAVSAMCGRMILPVILMGALYGSDASAQLSVTIRVNGTLTPTAGTITPTNWFAVPSLPYSATLTANNSNPAYQFDSWFLSSTNVILDPNVDQLLTDPTLAVIVTSTNNPSPV